MKKNEKFLRVQSICSSLQDNVQPMIPKSSHCTLHRDSFLAAARLRSRWLTFRCTYYLPHRLTLIARSALWLRVSACHFDWTATAEHPGSSYLLICWPSHWCICIFKKSVPCLRKSVLFWFSGVAKMEEMEKLLHPSLPSFFPPFQQSISKSRKYAFSPTTEKQVRFKNSWNFGSRHNAESWKSSNVHVFGGLRKTQGHPRSLSLAPTGSVYATSY